MNWYNRSHCLTQEQRDADLMLWWVHYPHLNGRKNGVGVLIHGSPKDSLEQRRDQMFSDYVSKLSK